MAQREGDAEEIVESFDGDTFAANKSLHDSMRESPQQVTFEPLNHDLALDPRRPRGIVV